MSFYENPKRVITVTATTLAGATFASEKVVSQSIEIPLAVKHDGGTSMIKSITILEECGQLAPKGADFNLFISSSDDNITEALNKPVGEDIADLDAVFRNMQGIVQFVKADFHQLVDADLASKTGLDLVVQTADGSRSLYLHIVTMSTWLSVATTDIKVKFGVEY